jgi:Tetracyclin repressor-like, C-terminal domain
VRQSRILDATQANRPGSDDESLGVARAAAWEDPATAEFLRSVILTAAHEPVALQRLATNFAQYVLQAVSSHLDDADRFTRASLMSSQMVGLAMTCYVWKAGAIAQMSSEDVVRYIAPIIQRYLTGKLGS